MEINLDNGTNRLNISGISNKVPIYHGKNVKITQGGRTKVRWVTKIHEISVNIQYLPDADYSRLTKILEDVYNIIITTEDSEVFKAVFIDDRLNLTKAKNADGEIYWTGTINFRE